MPTRFVRLLTTHAVLATCVLASVGQTARTGITAPGIQRPIASLTPIAVFTVVGHPDWLAVADHSLWVSSSGANTVTELDSTTNHVAQKITVAKPCSGLVAAFGSLWVPSCGSAALLRVDLKTASVQATIAVPPADSEGGITAGADSIWLVTGDSVLARIDPASNTLIAHTQLPAGSSNPLFADGYVWITSHSGNVLLKVDPAGNKVVATITVGSKPRFLTSGGGAVWTLNQGDGTISRVDMKTEKNVANIPAGIPGQGGEITYGFGAVWATVFGFPITKIDPQSNKVVGQWVGRGGDSLRAGLGSLWLSNLQAGNVWRLPPTL